MTGESGQSGPQTDGETAVVGTPPSLDGRAAHRASPAGTTLGRYVVLEEVGRGGMGCVYRAYDPKLQREVALKEVRPDTLEDEGARRLVAEARAMAKLSHPNVVAIYDAEEVAAGRIVLVMEYVAGKTLRTWVQTGERPCSEVIHRFIEAGRGLAAAHAAGLLHRDFKPSNVLVAPEGRVKVTDFGLAKPGGEGSASASSRDVSAESLELRREDLTEAGVIVGTPRYMAPEQHRPSKGGPGRSANPRGEALTEAADQYAFCVALWEALCGEAPFSGRDLARHKREGPPQWSGPPIPRRIHEALRRGLSVKPRQRWPGMETLLEALAYDPAKRRRRWTIGAAVFGIVALGATSLESWVSARSQRCGGAQEQLAGTWDEIRRTEVQAAIEGSGVPYAERVWDRTVAELDAHAAAWVAMHVEACEATTVRGEQSPAVMDLRMGCLHRARVDLEAVTAVLADADEEVVRKAHRLTAGLRSVSQCADIEALQAEVEPPRPQDTEAVEDARASLAAAQAASKAGRYEQAQAEVEAAKRRLTHVEYGPVGTELALVEGSVLDSLGEYPAAEAAYQRALGQASTFRQARQIGDAAQRLMFTVGYRQQRFEEGLRYRELAEGMSIGDPEREAAVRSSLAAILHVQGKYPAAEAEYRRTLELELQTLGPEHLNVADTRHNLAVVLGDEGKLEETETQLRRVLDLWERVLGPQHPDVSMARNNLVATLSDQGKYEEAEVEARKVIAVRVATLGPEHPLVANARVNLATSLQVQGDLAEAEAQYREALSVWDETLGPEHSNVAAVRNNLASLLQEQGKYEQAEAEFRSALALWNRTLGPDHPRAGNTHNNLAMVLDLQGKDEEARAEFERGLALREKALGSDHPQVATSRANLAAFLLEHGEVKRAHELAVQAWARDQRADTPPRAQARTAFLLARTSWATQGTQARPPARQLAQRSLSIHVETGGQGSQEATAVEAWLASHQAP